MTSDFDIRVRPDVPDAALVARLGRLHTSTFGHVRLWGICRGLRALDGAIRATGPAVTLALPGADASALLDALDHLRAGDMVMIDRLGDTLHACIGGLFAQALKNIGVAGVVVDGPVTDLVELRAVGLPLWCRGASSLTTRRLGLGGRLNAPVSIGGVVVHPGDLVLGDADGVIVLEPAEAMDALTQAEQREVWEARVQTSLNHGHSLRNSLAAANLSSPEISR